MSLTKQRTFQYVGLLAIFLAMAGGYWYWRAQGAATLNSSQSGNLKNGLVGYWTFDGNLTTSTTATDSGSGGNNGTLTNGPTMTAGKLGQALSFDGSDDRVTLATGITTSTTNTVSAWIYPSSNSGAYNMIAGDAGGNNGIFLDAGTATCGNIQTINFYYSGADHCSNISIPNNEWTLISVVNSAGAVTFYINGHPAGSASSAPSYTFASIGNDNSSETFAGKIDDIRVYSTALGAAAVYDLYNLGSTQVNAAQSPRDALSDGLAGYWPLDDGTSGATPTSATDLSTNGSTGTLTNGPTWTTGQIGSAVSFDGGNDYIDTTNESAYDYERTSPFSVSAWLYRNNNGSGDIYISKSQNGGAFQGWELSASASNDWINLNFIGTSDSLPLHTAGTSSFTTGAWHHVVMTYNGNSSSTGIHIYIDGVDQALTGSGTISSTMLNSQTINIGRSPGGGGNWDGKIDEVRVYGRTLTSDEVTKLYRTTVPSNPDTRLKGYWSFDERAMNGTTTALDLSGAGNTGTINGNPTKVIGSAGQALHFDGTGDYVGGADIAALDSASAFTISAWMKLDAANNYLALRQRKTSTGFVGMTYWNDGTMNFDLNNNDGGFDYAVYPQTDTGWHHWVLAYDGALSGNSNRLKMYLDGVLVSPTYFGTIPSATANMSGGTFRMGRDASDQDSTGSMDEVRIYNTALGATEIYNLYQQGKVAVNQPQSNGGTSLNDGLRGYWKLDDGTSGATPTSATDSSINGSTGTLTSGPTWTTGQIGNAVAFDGTNDYIASGSASSIDDIDASGGITISTWAYITPATTGSRMIASKGSPVGGCSCGFEYYVIESSGQYGLRFQRQYSTTNIDNYSTYGTLASGQWNHLVMTWDGSTNANNLKLYINAASPAQNRTNGSGSKTSDAAQNLNIGADQFGTTTFKGNLDEVRVYGRVLSEEEIRTMYKTTAPTNPESNLIGYWSFNGPDVAGTTAYDRSGKGNNGTMTNGPVRAIGKIGQGMTFSGSNQYVAMGSSVISNVAVTACAWVKPTSAPILEGIFIDEPFWLYLWSDGGTQLAVGVSNDGTGTTPKSAEIINQNEWTHVCGVRFANNTVTMYINGAQSGTPAQSAGTIGSPISIGNIGGSGGTVYDFTGGIDDVRIYTGTLSAAQILALYNLGK